MNKSLEPTDTTGEKLIKTLGRLAVIFVAVLILGIVAGF